MEVFFRGLIPFYLLLFIAQPDIHSQVPAQNIRGRILDKITSEPIGGAYLVLPGTDPLKGILSDSAGFFIFRNVKAGRYDLTITHIGYHDQVLYGLLVNSGKELILEIGLAPRTNILDEVKVSGSNKIDPLSISNLHSRIITVEETMRYAATFNDPVRAAASFPGVVLNNDQANHAVIRGNSPNGLLWRIEGADVVNPNHLTNAGTFSDKPSLTGGGVAIISSQLLSESVFLSGAFPAEYGNVLSGIFDYRLRKGNNRKYEFTGQAGFLGIDFAAEGPFSLKYDGSFLINYRYSTIGLFELAGIPIGDEKINFQDLSFNIYLPSKKNGDFTLFAIGGKSITDFRAERDSSAWLYQKDRTDYDFYSDMGVAGITHEIHPGADISVHTTVAFSMLKSGRQENYINQDYTSSFKGFDRLDAGKISLSSGLTGKIGNHNILKAGAVLNRDNILFMSATAEDLNLTMANKDAYIMAQPFVQWDYSVSDAVAVSSGLHIQYSDFNRQLLMEPRGSFSWSIGHNRKINLGYGLHSRMQHPSVYFNSFKQNRLLGLTRAHHFVAGFTEWFKDDLVLRAEIYLQNLFDVPVSADNPNSFSAINLNETALIGENLINKGTGKNYGVDLSLERKISAGFYYLLAGSAYNSEYKGSDGITRDTRFNGRYQIKATAGRELNYGRTQKLNTFGINITSVLAGGLRYTPVDPALSYISGSTVYRDEKAFSEKFKDFFRLDARIILRRNKNSFTETFALDIQNLTNRKNTAWIYYDEVQKSIVTKEQLGLIPFFSYRIEF
jgi:hypothetical protein